jgi:hypothetical protein
MKTPGQDERVGRILLIGAMIVGLVFEVAQPLLTMIVGGEALLGDIAFTMQIAIGLLMRLSLLILLFVETFQGREWARISLGVLYVVSAVFRYWPMIGAKTSEVDALDVAAVAVFLALSILLLSAVPIRAYGASVRTKKGR